MLANLSQIAINELFFYIPTLLQKNVRKQACQLKYSFCVALPQCRTGRMGMQAIPEGPFA